MPDDDIFAFLDDENKSKDPPQAFSQPLGDDNTLGRAKNQDQYKLDLLKSRRWEIKEKRSSILTVIIFLVLFGALSFTTCLYYIYLTQTHIGIESLSKVIQQPYGENTKKIFGIIFSLCIIFGMPGLLSILYSRLGSQISVIDKQIEIDSKQISIESVSNNSFSADRNFSFTTKSKFPIGKLLFTILWIMFTTYGLWLIKPNFDTCFLATRAFNWPVNPGKIDYSYVEESETQMLGNSKNIEKSFSSCQPYINYSYYALGKMRNHSNFSLATRLNTGSGCFRNLADAIVKEYPHNAKVEVYCSPDDPEISCLQPGFEPIFPFEGIWCLTLSLWLMPLVVLSQFFFKNDWDWWYRSPRHAPPLPAAFMLAIIILGQFFFVPTLINVITGFLPANGKIDLDRLYPHK